MYGAPAHIPPQREEKCLGENLRFPQLIRLSGKKRG